MKYIWHFNWLGMRHILSNRSYWPSSEFLISSNNHHEIHRTLVHSFQRHRGCPLNLTTITVSDWWHSTDNAVEPCGKDCVVWKSCTVPNFTWPFLWFFHTYKSCYVLKAGILSGFHPICDSTIMFNKMKRTMIVVVALKISLDKKQEVHATIVAMLTDSCSCQCLTNEPGCMPVAWL